MADLPGDITTPATIAPGESLEGSIWRRNDRDWIALEVTEGQILSITVDGTGDTPLSDSKLAIRDADGILIEGNDDSGDGYNSALILLADRTGTVYVEVSGYDRLTLGSYTVAVADAVMPVDVLPALDWGTQQPDTDITYFFAPSGKTLNGYTSEGFNAYEKAQFAAAFDLIEAVSGLTFREVARPGSADLRLVLDKNEIKGEFLGYFNPPGEAGAGVGVFDGKQWDRQPGGSLDAGGYDFVTIVHEILHGLGMSHPHDNGGGSEIFPGVSEEFDDFGYFGLNEGIYTTMSYNTGHPGDDDSQGHGGEKWGYEYGPMALDIAVLQDKYGANATTAGGDDVYTLVGRNKVGTFWQAIWDTGGVDEIRHEGARGATIDLRAATLRYEIGGGGFLSEADGIAGGLTIAAGVVIETATGGSGADRITGNAVANVLVGNAGGDVLVGGDGDDDLQGGAGRDRLAGGLGGDNLSGGGGADRFVFAAGDSDAGTGDYIGDFGAGRDRIDLRSVDGLGFIGTAAFGATGAGEVRFQVEGDETVVAADANGDGVADLVFRLGGVSAIGANDLIL